jgi:hypothetical protein
VQWAVVYAVDHRAHAIFLLSSLDFGRKYTRVFVG